MVRIWHKYDPGATYYIPTDKLDNLIEDFIKCDESKTMFITRDESVINKNYRMRLIGSLEIPTYNRSTKVMFYDVMQKIVLRAFMLQHNKRKAR